MYPVSPLICLSHSSPQCGAKKVYNTGSTAALCRAGECRIWTIFPRVHWSAKSGAASSQQQPGTLQLMSFIVTGVPSWR